MFTLQLCAFYILSTLCLFVSIPRAALTSSKASEQKHSCSSKCSKKAKPDLMEKIRQIYKLHSPCFRCLWLILHRDCLLGVAFLLGHYSWFQFESLNQSINHRRKGRHSHSSWNTPRYIFHTPDQPLKSLSFDINSLGSPQRPWAVHLHAGQAGRFIYRQSCFILNAPRRFTVQQLCTPNSTSA